MSYPFPSSSLQPANPPPALSRLVPVVSLASAGSQQAINMLKEQNRLLTKVSGGTGGGGHLRMGLGKEYEAVESVPSAWPTLVTPEKDLQAVLGELPPCSCVQLFAG